MYIDNRIDIDYFFDYGNNRFILFNNVQKTTIDEGWPYLYNITEEQINKIDNWLSNAPTNRFTFCHVPISQDSWNSGGKLFDCQVTPEHATTHYPQDGYFGMHELFVKHKVRANFAGHLHTWEGCYFYEHKNDMNYFITSGVGGGAAISIENSGPQYWVNENRLRDFNWLNIIVNNNTEVIVKMNIIGKNSGDELIPGSGIYSSSFDVDLGVFSGNQPTLSNNGWQKVWSNYGNGNINGWKVRDFDNFYVGDFDGDGAEELFCVQTGTNHKWMTILDYYNGDWHWKWSNYGYNHMMLPYRDNFIVGDYDGDGKDEVLGNDIDGWTTMFSFYNNSWHWKWSDNGNNQIRPYKDNLVSGDFNGDGKDEILGSDLPNGWTTMFNFENNNFQWGWSDYGKNHAIRPYRNNLRAGDFDGDGKDEILGFHTWATLFDFENNNFQWGWSTNGGNSFGGWTYPILTTDAVLIGDIDTYDNKDEIMFIQTGSSASWATSLDLKDDQSGWNWNWSANNYNSAPYISVPYMNDWSIADNSGSNTRYILIKAEANKPEYLMALRKYGCGGNNYNYLISLYESTNGDNKSVMNIIQKQDKDNIIDFVSNDWSVYPNPSNGLFYIQLNNIDDNSTIEVYNQSGKLVKTVKNINSTILEVDLSSYSVGLYLVVFKNSNFIQTRKSQKMK